MCDNLRYLAIWAVSVGATLAAGCGLFAAGAPQWLVTVGMAGGAALGFAASVAALCPAPEAD